MRHDPSSFMVPDGFWDRPQIDDALVNRDIGRLFRLVQQYAGASQPGIGMRVGMAQSEISKYINGKRLATEFEIFERVADGLDMPDGARMRFGLAPRTQPSRAAIPRPRPMQTEPGGGEPDSVDEIGERIEALGASNVSAAALAHFDVLISTIAEDY